MALTLYKSLVLPHLDYCDVVYMTANKDLLNKLQLVQNVACRTLLLADNRTHIADMHNELGLYTLAERRDYHLSTLCHKNIYSEEKTGLSKMFQKVEARGRITRFRNSCNMHVPKVKSSLGRHAIGFRGPVHWNKLPNKCKESAKLCTSQRLLGAKCTETLDNHPT